MFQPSGILAFLTDFGSDSFYVAEMHASALAVSRDLSIVDITHGVPPQDVVQASWHLFRAVNSFPPGTVIVCVVDPGVGTTRQILVAEINSQVVVAPDNGLLDVLLSRHKADRIHELNNSEFFGRQSSHTFHGRDIMAPTAAHLVGGVSLNEIGPRRTRPLIQAQADCLPKQTETYIEGSVVYFDPFGNAITNILREDLPNDWSMGELSVAFSGEKLSPVFATYGEVAEGEPVALFGSSGQLEIAVRAGNAQQAFNQARGAAVKVSREMGV